MFRVLAFTVKPRESADSRYRILQYHSIAQRDGVRIDHRSLMGSRYFRWQIENSHFVLRLLLLPILLLIRLCQVLFLAPTYDAVWISREMLPFGPPLLERLLLRRCPRVILDVDDALHISDKESSHWLPRLLRDYGKFGRMASRYTAVVCGNAYLADFYLSHSANVQIVPTVVEADRYATVAPTDSDHVRIGWIGTPLNRHHLELLQPVFLALGQQRPFKLIIVGLNEPLYWDIPNVRYLKWTLAAELDFFTQFDIGIMPLKDSPFARGKCAFKLLQYMAAGQPVIASPVGANCDVIENGRNGFLASTEEEWLTALRTLIDDPNLRRRMGESGRELVRNSYSVESAWPPYAAVLKGTSIPGSTCAV
jgi:glycosyltransferase involved in cell wall biosynthesis